MMTKVIEYKRRPLMCKRCLEYGHSKNQCEKEHRYDKCATSRHVKEECSSNEARGHHCKGITKQVVCGALNIDTNKK